MSEIKEYSVTELSANIKTILQSNFTNIRLRGEISGYEGPSSSGHTYFSIKEKDAKIDATIWRNVFNSLKTKPEEGLEVIVTGSVSSYAPKSRYSINIISMELAGIGSLMALFEKLKKKLTEEGLFAESRKKPLPKFPNRIGIITSARGAVIEDISSRLKGRFVNEVFLWDVSVQGNKCAQEVAMAIEGFNNMVHKPDLLIVARGGGSIEDLWGFNEEIVVRAAYKSTIPIISAIGHETDTTLLDLVADRRAPTPTAAAEIAAPKCADLYLQIANSHKKLTLLLQKELKSKNDTFRMLSRAMPSLDNVLGVFWRKYDEQCIKLKHRYEIAMNNKINKFNNIISRFKIDLVSKIIKSNKQQVEAKARLLDSFSYRSVLRRGFSLLIDSNSKPIATIEDIKLNQGVKICMYNGKALASITKIEYDK